MTIPESRQISKPDDVTLLNLIGVLPRLAQSLTGHDTVKILPIEEITRRADAYDDAEQAVLARVRELVEEARKEGEASTSREVAQTISRLRTLAADLRGPNVR